MEKIAEEAVQILQVILWRGGVTQAEIQNNASNVMEQIMAELVHWYPQGRQEDDSTRL